tara:strand:+ start:861 stop:1406 length:546 start_codon:yes stop_codon:yes gene_type:complete
MADIHITIDDEEEGSGPQKYVFNLDVRKTLSGDFVVRDHPDIDIVIMVQRKKIVTFPKEVLNNEVYLTQDKLFDFLSKKGVISRQSVEGGALHGSMEAEILEHQKLNVVNIALMTVAKFVEEEKPYYEYIEKFEKEQEKRLTAPSEAESSEFDPSRHGVTKGTLQPIYIRSPYGMSFTYRE